MTKPLNLSNFVWSIADQLRGVFKPNQYGSIVLPFTILRRMEQVLEPHRDALAEIASDSMPPQAKAIRFKHATGLTFHTTSPFTLARILEDPDSLRANLMSYVDRFSENVRDLFTHYDFEKTVDKLDQNDRLFIVLDQFATIDLSPANLTNARSGAEPAT